MARQAHSSPLDCYCRYALVSSFRVHPPAKNGYPAQTVKQAHGELNPIHSMEGREHLADMERDNGWWVGPLSQRACWPAVAG
jgi:hypothetical protein